LEPTTILSGLEKLARYRPWFYAAAVYNALWGAAVSLWPHAIFDLLGMPRSNYPALFQCIGMMVGAYAIAYWLIARNPVRYGALVYVGLLGKVLGPLGLVWSALRGDLPWVFGWVNVTNDLIWLPSFFAFAWLWWKQENGK
jgi:hypothetical protein